MLKYDPGIPQECPNLKGSAGDDIRKASLDVRKEKSEKGTDPRQQRAKEKAELDLVAHKAMSQPTLLNPVTPAGGAEVRGSAVAALRRKQMRRLRPPRRLTGACNL